MDPRCQGQGQWESLRVELSFCPVIHCTTQILWAGFKSAAMASCQVVEMHVVVVIALGIHQTLSLIPSCSRLVCIPFILGVKVTLPNTSLGIGTQSQLFSAPSVKHWHCWRQNIRQNKVINSCSVVILVLLINLTYICVFLSSTIQYGMSLL